MSMKHSIDVPAKAAEVKAFLDGNRNRYLNDLTLVKNLVLETAKTDPRLRIVYKIYSRGEKQASEELKHPRKVRLKFNLLNEGQLTASLFDIPDIVGFTVVVPYPTDINGVCEVLDELIDSKQIQKFVAPAGGSSSTPKAKSLIQSRYGRPLEENGYFACHYNVRTPGLPPRPVCEIQVKTLLQDAWGAKSHDLTYKPQGQTDRDLIASFNILGDTLAKIDLQSDVIRSSIERKARVRERKRSQVQVESIRAAAKDAAKSGKLKTIFASIQALKPGPHLPEEAIQLRDELFHAFPTNRRAACVLMCFLAAISQQAGLFQHAQETIATWYQDTADDYERISALAIAGLAAFSAGDVAEAIDNQEEAGKLIDQINETYADLPLDQRERLNQVGNSTFTSLAYFHADQIGSDDGEKRGSRELARTYLEHSMTFRKRLALPNALQSTDKEIRNTLANQAIQNKAFSTLDNDTFVLIQTAKDPAALKHARDRLQLLHDNAPTHLREMADLLFAYHEYCARMRLAELETA